MRGSPGGANAELESLAGGLGLEVDAASGYLEFEYQGRDSSRFVVRLLMEFARVVGDADGEIVCSEDGEDGSPKFEFYSFRGGQLIRQWGHVVRGAPEVVTKPQPDVP